MRRLSFNLIELLGLNFQIYRCYRSVTITTIITFITINSLNPRIFNIQLYKYKINTIK